MSKMREAFEKWAKTEGLDLSPHCSGNGYDDERTALAFRGYQAAIAAAKEGGAQAWIEHHKGGDNLNWEQWDHPNKPATPLYKLPEDAP